jgi:hypothetical protein
MKGRIITYFVGLLTAVALFSGILYVMLQLGVNPPTTPMTSPVRAVAESETLVKAPVEIPPGVVEFYYSPTCGCCGSHAEAFAAHSESHNLDFELVLTDAADLTNYKQNAGIPPNLWSCHTSYSGGYFLEGHVPMSAVEWLLTERPENVKGIATRHSDDEMDMETWLGEAYYIVYTDGTVSGPIPAGQ